MEFFQRELLEKGILTPGRNFEDELSEVDGKTSRRNRRSNSQKELLKEIQGKTPGGSPRKNFKRKGESLEGSPGEIPNGSPGNAQNYRRNLRGAYRIIPRENTRRNLKRVLLGNPQKEVFVESPNSSK